MQDNGRACSSSHSLEKFSPGKDRPVNSVSVSLWQMTIGPWVVALGPSQTFTERAQRCRACCIWLMCSRSVQSSSATLSSMLDCRYASVENRRRPERRGQPSPAWPRKTLLKLCSRVLTLPKTDRSVPTPANDHKSLTGMDIASEIGENPKPWRRGPGESRPLRCLARPPAEAG